MSVYKIADFIIDFKNRFDYLPRLCKGFEAFGASGADDFSVAPDFTIEVNDDELNIEREQSDGNYSNAYLEAICAYRKLCVKLPARDSMLLHSSVIDVGGRGIAFLARSGVGKTTHTMLWHNMLERDGKNGGGPGKMRIINGDKPIIRFFGGEPYAYGTPWAGKENIKLNARVRLTDLCFIERCEHNETLPLEKDMCIDRLMAQMLLPNDAYCAAKTLEMADMLLDKCSLHLIKCNPTPDAAKTAYEAIFNKGAVLR